MLYLPRFKISRRPCEFLLVRDVMVSLPTEKGKSLGCASSPLAFDWLKEHYVTATSEDYLELQLCFTISNFYYIYILCFKEYAKWQ